MNTIGQLFGYMMNNGKGEFSNSEIIDFVVESSIKDIDALIKELCIDVFSIRSESGYSTGEIQK